MTVALLGVCHAKSPNIASRLRNRSVVSATILALVGAQAGLAQAATASGPSYGPDSRDLVTHTPIKHVIIIIGENWSFDSLFATYVPKSSDKVWNLLSENILKPDGSPGMNYSKPHPAPRTPPDVSWPCPAARI